MTFWGFFSLLLRCVGLINWADAAWSRHEANVSKQSVADSPTTRGELEKTLRKDDL